MPRMGPKKSVTRTSPLGSMQTVSHGVRQGWISPRFACSSAARKARVPEAIDEHRAGAQKTEIYFHVRTFLVVN